MLVDTCCTEGASWVEEQAGALTGGKIGDTTTGELSSGMSRWKIRLPEPSKLLTVAVGRGVVAVVAVGRGVTVGTWNPLIRSS